MKNIIYDITSSSFFWKTFIEYINFRAWYSLAAYPKSDGKTLYFKSMYTNELVLDCFLCFIKTLVVFVQRQTGCVKWNGVCNATQKLWNCTYCFYLNKSFRQKIKYSVIKVLIVSTIATIKHPIDAIYQDMF